MTRRFRKDDVETHAVGYYGSPLPAVNVKVHRQMTDKDVQAANESGDPRFTMEWIEEHLTDEDLRHYFQFACEAGFEDLQMDAEFVFAPGVKVWAEGRSGGWAVVEGLGEVETWDAIMVNRWSKFAKLARETADSIPEQMASLIQINRFDAWADEQDDPERLASKRSEICDACLSGMSA
jgi:hypothetical protein